MKKLIYVLLLLVLVSVAPSISRADSIGELTEPKIGKVYRDGDNLKIKFKIEKAALDYNNVSNLYAFVKPNTGNKNDAYLIGKTDKGAGIVLDDFFLGYTINWVVNTSNLPTSSGDDKYYIIITSNDNQKSIFNKDFSDYNWYNSVLIVSRYYLGEKLDLRYDNFFKVIKKAKIDFEDDDDDDEFTYTFNKDLYRGMKKDPDVKALQTILGLEGLYEYEPTGNFTKKTSIAVGEFQKKYNINPEIKERRRKSYNYVGPRTRQVLNELYSDN